MMRMKAMTRVIVVVMIVEMMMIVASIVMTTAAKVLIARTVGMIRVNPLVIEKMKM